MSTAQNTVEPTLFFWYNVKWDNLKFTAADLRDVHVTFDLPMNTSNNPAYVKMKYLRLNIEYITQNYVPSVSFEPNIIEYGKESLVTVDVVETNNTLSTDTVETVVHVTDGLRIVDGSISSQGTFDPDNLRWYAKTNNGKAKLTFKVTPASPAVAGMNNVSAYIQIPLVLYINLLHAATWAVQERNNIPRARK